APTDIIVSLMGAWVLSIKVMGAPSTPTHCCRVAISTAREFLPPANAGLINRGLLACWVKYGFCCADRLSTIKSIVAAAMHLLVLSTMLMPYLLSVISYLLRYTKPLKLSNPRISIR